MSYSKRPPLAPDWPAFPVAELERRGILLVEDGNHGEYRPRPHEFMFGSVAYVRAADMDGGRVLFESAARISDTAVARIRKGIGRGGDILFSHKGTVGKLACVPHGSPPFVCSPQTTFWRTLDENKLDRRFLYGFMQCLDFTEQWSARKGETDMADYVSLTAQRGLLISMPPIEEQRAIGMLFGTLDDKIDLNRRMNRRLEELASAIFQSWFVDFDPVVAKAAGRAPFGMDAEIAELFPALFEDSDFGPIPRGWRLSPLGDEFSVEMGQSPPGSTYNEAGEGFPFFQGSTDFGERFPRNRVFCTEPTRVADVGDTLVSVRAPVGAMNMAWHKCAIGRGVSALRHRTGSQSYTYYAMRALQSELDVFNGDGTVFGSISGPTFRSIQVIAPCDKLIAAFDRIASPLDSLYAANAAESRTLAALRDALLPKLLSREIHVERAGEHPR